MSVTLVWHQESVTDISHARKSMRMNANMQLGFGTFWWDVAGKTEEPRVLASPLAEQIYTHTMFTR